MKSRSKPERKEHEQMMTKLKTSSYKAGPQAKSQAKAGLKKARKLKREGK